LKTSFDHLADDYDSIIAGKHRIWTVQHTVETLEAICPLSGEILDIGCGTGLYSRAAIKKSDFVVSMDLSMAMLRNAKKLPRQVYICADSNLVYPFKDNTFSVITAMDVLSYLSDLQLAFAEIKRLLKPGGYFFSVVPNSRSLVRQTARMLKAGSYSASVPGEKKFFAEKTLKNLLEDHFDSSGVKVIRPVPGFAGAYYERLPFFIKRWLHAGFLGLGLLGWGR